MNVELSTEEVWQTIDKELFAVVGMVNAANEARTAGLVYIVRDRKLYLATGHDTWKARHIAANPHVSVTIPIAKRVPIMPWLKIPQATITFQGTARVFPAAEASPELLRALPAQGRRPRDGRRFLRGRDRAGGRVCHLRRGRPPDGHARTGEGPRSRAGALTPPCSAGCLPAPRVAG